MNFFMCHNGRFVIFYLIGLIYNVLPLMRQIKLFRKFFKPDEVVTPCIIGALYFSVEKIAYPS